MDFISLYIPRQTSIDDIVANLKEESDSVAIKFESLRDVRDRLQEALKNVIQHIKMQKEIPEKGTRDIRWNFRRELSRKRSFTRRRTLPARTDNLLSLRG